MPATVKLLVNNLQGLWCDTNGFGDVFERVYAMPKNTAAPSWESTEPLAPQIDVSAIAFIKIDGWSKGRFFCLETGEMPHECDELNDVRQLD